MPDAESLKNIQEKYGRGGARPGAGRPKGKLEPKTIERNAARDAFMSRVAKNADKLFNAQFNKAVGETYLMWKHVVGSGYKAREVVEVVEDLEIIKQYLDDTLDVTEGEFYYITTQPADNHAIQGMLDRSFGRATEKVENSGEQKLIVETRVRKANADNDN